ncbi:MAG: LPS export ABC transporter periplasmic protein LptC [Bacteroidales bacterium]|nr:LPS export ABC transporter periplasmic protein LptC [Bacteroidales bacterium]
MTSGIKYNLFKAVLVAGTVLLSSCEKRDLVVKDLQIKDMPSLSARDLQTMYTDSGKVTLIVRTPLIQQFKSREDPYTLFPEGLTVLFYEMQSEPQASITSRYARYTEKDDVWELRDSVVAVNSEGDILETELLYWSEPRERIWSDRFVRFTHNDQIIMGTGFESDTRFTNWSIRNVTGTIYIEDEQKVAPPD